MPKQSKHLSTTIEKKYLSNIAGYEEEKKELFKIINIIKNYHVYKELGIEVPRGLILQGPPGCGKTLMANAVSCECGVPFYYFKLEDEEPSKIIKELQKIYKEAESNAPAIVYIDEISELVSCRRFTSDISRMNLQFLLTKLDGNQSNQKEVMTIASTNCYGEIPASLVRSGRMDKKIKIDLPDVSSRESILKYYINNHPMFDNLNTRLLAIKLEGMSGADIKTLINNALIEYVDYKDHIEVDDFNKIVNEMNFETIGKHWKSRNNLRKVIAHEVGHSLVSWALENNPGSITAIRYNSTGGFTSFLGSLSDDELMRDDYYNDEMTYTMTLKQAFNQYCIGLGGTLGEIIFCKENDSGLVSDIEYIRDTHKSLCAAGLYGLRYLPYRWAEDSEKLKRRTEKHFLRVTSKAYKQAKKILKKYKGLGNYLIKLTEDNNDSLSNAQIINAINYYKAHTIKINKEYKNINIMEDK